MFRRDALSAVWTTGGECVPPIVDSGAFSLDRLRGPAFTVTELVLGRGPPVLPGDIARVRYDAWLWDAAAPEGKGAHADAGELEFVLNVDDVIRALRDGLRGMRAGGLRRLLAPPEYGLGSAGAGAIPPNATLVLDVELLDVRSVVTDSAPFAAVAVAEGAGPVLADGQRVNLTYDGWLYDASAPRGEGRMFARGRAAVLVVGDGTAPSGWHRGLRGVRVGGTRRLTLPPDLAFGSLGRRPRIPPHATLVYEIVVEGVLRP